MQTRRLYTSGVSSTTFRSTPASCPLGSARAATLSETEQTQHHFSARLGPAALYSPKMHCAAFKPYSIRCACTETQQLMLSTCRRYRNAQMVANTNQTAHGKTYSPVTPPLGGQPSATMPSSAAALAPSFSMSALYSGSDHALQSICRLMRPNTQDSSPSSELLNYYWLQHGRGDVHTTREHQVLRMLDRSLGSHKDCRG